MTFRYLIQADPTRLTVSCCRPARNQTASNRWETKRGIILLSTLKRILILIGLFLGLFWSSPFAGASRACEAPPSARTKSNFNSGWKLYVGDPKGAEPPAFDDSGWKNVTLPHPQDLSFVTVTVADKDGWLVPRSKNRVRFEVSGPGGIVDIDNGDATDHESFQAKERKANNGLVLVIVRAKSGQSGQIKLTARSDGLAGAQILIHAR